MIQVHTHGQNDVNENLSLNIAAHLFATKQ